MSPGAHCVKSWLILIDYKPVGIQLKELAVQIINGTLFKMSSMVLCGVRY